MKREGEWGVDTLRSRKMGGVYLGEGKNGGSLPKRSEKLGAVYLREEKNGGSTHLRPKAASL